MSQRKRTPPHWAFMRDVILFFSGLSGVAAETVVWVTGGRPPDTTLMIVFVAMMGLPITLHKDEGG